MFRLSFATMPRQKNFSLTNFNQNIVNNQLLISSESNNQQTFFKNLTLQSKAYKLKGFLKKTLNQHNTITTTIASVFSYPPHPAPLNFTKKTQKLPYAIIAGVKKSGTRALLEFLYVHPQVMHYYDYFMSHRNLYSKT